jgi:hypothetical protein
VIRGANSCVKILQNISLGIENNENLAEISVVNNKEIPTLKKKNARKKTQDIYFENTRISTIRQFR